MVEGPLGLVPLAGPLLLVVGLARVGRWMWLIGKGWWALVVVLLGGIPTFVHAAMG